MQRDPDTAMILRLLEEEPSFEQSLETLGEAVGAPSLTALLTDYLNRCGLTIAEVADQTLLSKSYTYQVFNGVRNPGRNAVISIARVMGASLGETRRLLSLAQKGDLYPRVRRDAAIIFAISKDYDLMRMDRLLSDIGEPSLLRGV